VKIQGLTPQQYRIACMVADGETDKAIAAKLHVHVQSVRFHIARIVAAWELPAGKNRRVQIANRLQRPDVRTDVERATQQSARILQVNTGSV
jgi:DNA-binding NarL/FixJ family response regulator